MIFLLTIAGKCAMIALAFGGVAQLGERTVRIRKVESSILFVSTKQVLDEHLFLQRRLRRKVFALIHNKKSVVLGVIPRRRFS